MREQRSHGGVVPVERFALPGERLRWERQPAAVADQLGLDRRRARLEHGRARPVSLIREPRLTSRETAAAAGNRLRHAREATGEAA